jgi:hypothetical protein
VAPWSAPHCRRSAQLIGPPACLRWQSPPIRRPCLPFSIRPYLPAKDAYNAASWRSLFRQLFSGFNVVDHFTVVGSLHERQGAAWPLDVIAGRGKTEGRLYPTGNLPRIYRSWKEIRDDFTSITRTAADARTVLNIVRSFCPTPIL